MKDRHQKFTLTEFLVAIALSLGIFSLLALSLSSNVKIWYRGKDRLNLINNLISIDKTVQSIFNGVKPFKVNKNKKRKLIFSGQKNRLSLLYQHQLSNYKEGVLRFITLYHQDNKLLAKYYSRYEHYLSDEEASHSTLAEDIDQIQFFYAAEEKLESFKVHWYDTWQDKTYLPLAIRLQITYIDNKTENFLWRLSHNSLYQRVGNFTEGAE